MRHVMIALKIPIAEQFDAGEVLTLFLERMHETTQSSKCAEAARSIVNLFSFRLDELNFQRFTCQCESSRLDTVTSEVHTKSSGLFDLPLGDAGKEKSFTLAELLRTFENGATSTAQRDVVHSCRRIVILY